MQLRDGDCFVPPCRLAAAAAAACRFWNLVLVSLPAIAALRLCSRTSRWCSDACASSMRAVRSPTSCTVCAIFMGSSVAAQGLAPLYMRLLKQNMFNTGLAHRSTAVLS